MGFSNEHDAIAPHPPYPISSDNRWNYDDERTAYNEQESFYEPVRYQAPPQSYYDYYRYDYNNYYGGQVGQGCYASPMHYGSHKYEYVDIGDEYSEFSDGGDSDYGDY